MIEQMAERLFAEVAQQVTVHDRETTWFSEGWRSLPRDWRLSASPGSLHFRSLLRRRWRQIGCSAKLILLRRLVLRQN
jgi:hypothetical protein